MFNEINNAGECVSIRSRFDYLNQIVCAGSGNTIVANLIMTKSVMAVVGLLLFLAVIFFFLKRQRGNGGFKEYVKDADYREAVNNTFEKRSQAVAPANIDEKGIRNLVDQLLKRDDPTFAKEQLKSLGGRAVPALLEALKDPRFLTKSNTSEMSLESAPLEKLLDLLEPFSPPSAIGSLSPLLRHEDEYFRKTAALALGNIATDECIQPLTTALSDADDYVRSYAMMGIQRAIESKRDEPKFFGAMFDQITSLLDRDDNSLSQAPETLLLLDREKASRTITDDRFFHLRNPILTQILYALNKFEVTVSPEKLQHLMEPIQNDLKEYPNDVIYGQSLIALARTTDPHFDQKIQFALKHPNKRVAETAAEAITMRKGLSKIMDILWSRMDEPGFSQLSEPERVVLSVRMLIDQVNNGGFSQYFLNSSGDHVQDALKGLQAIKAKQTEEMLRKAIKLFGSGGPSPDRDKRIKQLEKFSSKADEQLGALEEEFYNDEENREAKLQLYIAAQSEHFNALPKPKSH